MRKRKFLVELGGLASGICFAASFWELFQTRLFASYLTGPGLLFLMAGVGCSIPWLALNKPRLTDASLYRRFKRWGSARRMDWRQFEFLVAEHFRRQGFSVETNPSKGADGGIDIRISRNGQKGIVQCKHFRTRKCGVSVVREMKGLMAAEGVALGAVACSSGFSRAARRFGQENRIALITEMTLRRNEKSFA